MVVGSELHLGGMMIALFFVGKFLSPKAKSGREINHSLAGPIQF